MGNHGAVIVGGVNGGSTVDAVLRPGPLLPPVPRGRPGDDRESRVGPHFSMTRSDRRDEHIADVTRGFFVQVGVNWQCQDSVRESVGYREGSAIVVLAVGGLTMQRARVVNRRGNSIGPHRGLDGRAINAFR